MAFDRENFANNGMASGNGAPKIYGHRDATSTKAAIATADYFLPVYQFLEVGDFLMVNGSDGSCVLAVTASSSTTVTVEEATLI